MKFSWLFGPSLAQHHLLYAYVVVWLIQGGYATWIAWQWRRTRRSPRLSDPLEPQNDSQ